MASDTTPLRFHSYFCRLRGWTCIDRHRIIHESRPSVLIAMYATDEESTQSDYGCATPPLSPTKTISTEGWLSPRTPGSPHKSRSCLHFHSGGDELDHAFFSPPSSPTKPRFAARLKRCSTPEDLSPPHGLTLPGLTGDSPVKGSLPLTDGSSPGRPSNVARSTNRSLPATLDRSVTTKPPLIHLPDSSKRSPTPSKERRRCRSSSEGSIDALVAKYESPPTTPTEIKSIKQGSAQPVTHSDLSVRLVGLPCRYSSSPLRPSQWASRGGLLSPPRKSQTSTPDRFIHCRRPPTITRESFELNKPTERERVLKRGRRSGNDPFSRRVPRSDRLSAELRVLREAHTVTAGRFARGGLNPNLRLRNSSLISIARQISAGAVWNVGGLSAVNDTVTAISAGNGVMLGSGTMAPLYTSSFLNRPDPEAELNAYESRLALALEVDQTERVLHHTPLLSDQPYLRPAVAKLHGPHVWRDSAWTQDDATLRWSSVVTNLMGPTANDARKLLGSHIKRSADRCQFCPSDM